MAVSIGELWRAARARSPHFASVTSEGTATRFESQGWESITMESNLANEFVNLTIQMYLQQINIPSARDLFEDYDIGDNYENAFAGIAQRVATSNIKPVSPAFREIQDGGTVDPFVVRKPEAEERFFQQNFDFQNFITIQPQAMKTAFQSAYGLDALVSGWMEGLRNSYVLQKYENKMEAINKAINSTKTPLTPTQVITLPVSNIENMTEDELRSVVEAIQSLIMRMTIVPQTGAFNALSWKTHQSKDALRMLIRGNVIPQMHTKLRAGTYNLGEIALGLEDSRVMPVDNFGGLIPYEDAEFATPLYPVYDNWGAVSGFNQTENSKEVTVQENDVHWKDPNEDVIAVILDRGTIWTAQQNPLEMRTIQNPRGMYDNYFLNQMGGTIAYDALYPLVVIKKATQA